jgi:hypothetical protein
LTKYYSFPTNKQTQWNHHTKAKNQNYYTKKQKRWNHHKQIKAQKPTPQKQSEQKTAHKMHQKKNHLLKNTKTPITTDAKYHHKSPLPCATKNYIKEKPTLNSQKTIRQIHTFHLKEVTLEKHPWKLCSLKYKNLKHLNKK